MRSSIFAPGLASGSITRRPRVRGPTASWWAIDASCASRALFRCLLRASWESNPVAQRTRSTNVKSTSHRVIALLAGLAKGPAKVSVCQILNERAVFVTDVTRHSQTCSKMKGPLFVTDVTRHFQRFSKVKGPLFVIDATYLTGHFQISKMKMSPFS